MSDASPHPAPIDSPCIDECELDEALGLCRGCLRTLEEVRHWLHYDADERRAVLVRLEERRAALRS